MKDSIIEQIREALKKIANDPEAKQELTGHDWFGFSQAYLLLQVIDQLDEINEALKLGVSPRWREINE